MSSCNTVEELEPDTFSDTYDTQVKLLAKAVSEELSNKEFRKFVKNESLKTFDGDYNFLISPVLEIAFSDGSTLSQKLSSYFPSSKHFDSFISQNPRLQIAVPIHIDEWNTGEFVPSVVFLSNSFDEKDEFVEGFSNGVAMKLPLSDAEELDVPIVVISLNERTDEKGNLRQDLANTPTKRSFEGGGMELITMIGGCPNLSAIESILNGAPEFRVTISPMLFYSQPPVSISPFGGIIRDVVYYPPSRSSVQNNNFWALPSQIQSQFYWHRGNNRENIDYGQAAQFAWVEDDGGPRTNPISITPTVVLPSGVIISASFVFYRSNQDDFLGSQTVSYIDPDPSFYNVGSVSWQSRQ